MQNTHHSKHAHTHACTCGCNNPIVSILGDELFSKENVAKMTAGLPKSKPVAATPEAILYSGGTIRPMLNGIATPVEALGVAGGVVIATGALSDVKAAMDKKCSGSYKHITLGKGQTLLPGMFEPHIHTVFSGLMAGWIDVSPFDGQDLRAGYTKEWVAQTLKNGLTGHPGQVILATGLDPALIQPQGCDNFSLLNHTFLDGVSSGTPILIMSASGHTIYANTPALLETYRTQKDDPSMKQYKSGEDYVQQTNGLLEEETGMMPAITAFKGAILLTAANIVDHMDAFFKDANTKGVTSMYDALINTMYLPFLEAYLEAKQLPVRLGGARYCETLKEAKELPPYMQPKGYTDMYLGHVKIVSDGSNQGLTGYQSQDYACTLKGEPPCGIFNFKTTEEYQQLMDEVVVEKGWPLMIHANGDRAVTETIAAYKTVLGKYKGPELRNRIEHCSLLDSNGIKEMVEQKLSPSFLIGHVGYWGDVFENIIFKGQQVPGTNIPKVFTLDPCAAATKAKLRISLHSDHTVTPVGPLRMMEQSITRVMEGSKNAWPYNVLNTEEQLSNEQALKAVTYDAAWQCYADNWAGSLADGHFADFIILAQDPVTMPREACSMKMRNIKVLETWLGGVKVYTAPAQ